MSRNSSVPLPYTRMLFSAILVNGVLAHCTLIHMQSLNFVKYNQCAYDSRSARANNCILFQNTKLLSFPDWWTKRLLPSDHYYNNITSLCVPFCMWVQIWIFFQYISLKVDLLGQRMSTFTVLIHCQISLQNTLPVYIRSDSLWVPVSLHLHQRWIFANLMQEKTLKKTKPFLITEVEHFFRCLFAMNIPFSVNCLFTAFVHFSVGFLMF